jgi:hypothetical protein
MPSDDKLKLCNSVLESEKLEQYLSGKGGLVFTEFNTTYGFMGKTRALDAIGFPELENGIKRALGNYANIKSLIKNYEVELIEVHKWGFYGFGQLVGKSEIVQKYWSPKKIKKILIILGSYEFHPETNQQFLCAI